MLLSLNRSKWEALMREIFKTKISPKKYFKKAPQNPPSTHCATTPHPSATHLPTLSAISLRKASFRTEDVEHDPPRLVGSA